ncbi:hypothetical protein [Peterkaempfera griseoplana]|uniref:hypothetical protein n=1 Tax=Peterkaempfera griseoplana TaxID=66896 RepID=UPI0006E33924|nr:hypothetical protein [Peterkaempfera griseoplana]
MRPISARAAGLAAAVVCGAALLSLSPAHAAPGLHTAAPGTAPEAHRDPVITGIVTIHRTAPLPDVVIQGASLSRNPLDSGVALNTVTTVDNGTNVPITLSAGAVTINPGGSATVGQITSGDLFISASVFGSRPGPSPW